MVKLSVPSHALVCIRAHINSGQLYQRISSRIFEAPKNEIK